MAKQAFSSTHFKTHLAYYQFSSHFHISQVSVTAMPPFLGQFSVLVQAAMTKYHGLGGLKITEIYFSEFQRLNPNSECQHNQGLVRSRSRLQTVIFLLMIKGISKLSGISGISFMKVLSPFIRAPPSHFNHLPKAPSPNTIILGIRISTYEFKGNTNI